MRLVRLQVTSVKPLPQFHGISLPQVADEVAQHLDGLHGRVDVVLLGLVVLHHGGLRTGGIRFVDIWGIHPHLGAFIGCIFINFRTITYLRDFVRTTISHYRTAIEIVPHSSLKKLHYGYSHRLTAKSLTKLF